MRPEPGPPAATTPPGRSCAAGTGPVSRHNSAGAKVCRSAEADEPGKRRTPWRPGATLGTCVEPRFAQGVAPPSGGCCAAPRRSRGHAGRPPRRIRAAHRLTDDRGPARPGRCRPRGADPAQLGEVRPGRLVERTLLRRVGVGRAAARCRAARAPATSSSARSAPPTGTRAARRGTSRSATAYTGASGLSLRRLELRIALPALPAASPACRQQPPNQAGAQALSSSEHRVSQCSRADDAPLDRRGDRTGAGVDAELGVDVRQMRLHGGLRHEQLARHLAVAEPA